MNLSVELSWWQLFATVKMVETAAGCEYSDAYRSAWVVLATDNIVRRMIVAE